MVSHVWNPQQQERNRFVRFRTAYTFDRFVDLPRGGRHRILDYGCGEGHSIDALLERFPEAHVVAVDIADAAMSTCNSRFGDHPRVTALQATNGFAFDAIGNDFDVIQLNAVFEHLLPDERRHIVLGLWRRLVVGGYFVVTETPWRWFPIETHTTSFPLVNYLPDALALLAVRHCGRYPKTLTWHDALKQGVRGATVREIVGCLGASEDAVQIVRSVAPDARDMLEVWWHGECRKTGRRALAYSTLSWLRRLTGVVLSPWVNVVLRKRA